MSLNVIPGFMYLKFFIISIWNNTDDDIYNTCKRIGNITTEEGASLLVHCDSGPTVGRYVKIETYQPIGVHIPSTHLLTLCEVIVIGEPYFCEYKNYYLYYYLIIGNYYLYPSSCIYMSIWQVQHIFQSFEEHIY